MNFFVPRPGKLTETRRSSSSPSTPTMVPTPKLGCRTLRPSMGFASDRKSTRLNSSHGYISYAVFCLKKKHAHSCGFPQPAVAVDEPREREVDVVRHVALAEPDQRAPRPRPETHIRPRLQGRTKTARH